MPTMRRAALCIILTGTALLMTSALPADQPPSAGTASTTASGGSSSADSSPSPGAELAADESTTSTPLTVNTTSSPTQPAGSSPHAGLADAPPAPLGHHPGIKDSEEDDDDDDDWDSAIEALVDAVRVLMPKPLLAHLLSEESEELSQDRGDEGDKHQDSEEGDDDSDEEDDYWFDWGSMFGRRRRRRETGAPDTTTTSSPEDSGEGSDEESGEGAGEDEDYDEDLLWLILAGKGGAGRRSATKDRSHFSETLRTVFYRARNRVLARQQGRGQGVATPTHKLWLQLIPMVSQALNVSSEEVARGFGGMASRWLGEALYDLLFEDDDDDGQVDQDGEDEDDDPWNLNWDAGVKVNGSFNLSGASTGGGRPSSRRVGVGKREGREADPEDNVLSPSAVAYFLVELLGTMAGLSWGVWFAATHAG